MLFSTRSTLLPPPRPSFTSFLSPVGPYTDSEHISLAITDTLICYEMPFFAFAHWFAFSHTDYIDKHLHYAARMPFYYAFRDAFGFLDVFEDSRATLRGDVDYRTFEPVEGGMHQGIGRDRRIKAGLRYSKGGRKKYWLPMPQENSSVRHTGPISALKIAAEERNRARHAYAPILDAQADRVFHDETAEANSRLRAPGDCDNIGFNGEHDEVEYHEADHDEWTRELTFGDPEPETELLFAESRRLLFGDYHYPCVDVSSEEARRRMWDEEEQILKDQRAAFTSPTTRPPAPAPHPSLSLLTADGGGGLVARHQGYGAIGPSGSNSLGNSSLRSYSDPDPRAARSAVERSQKGKTSTAVGGSSGGRKGIYGGWAEQTDSSSPSSSRSHTHSHSTTVANNTRTIAEHPPSIPVIDYTPHEPITPDTDPTQGAIDLRYARTTTRPPAPRIPSAPTTTTQGGLGLNIGSAAAGGRSGHRTPPSPLFRPGSVTSVPPSPTAPAATSSESSPAVSASHPHPDASDRNGSGGGRGRKGSSPGSLPHDAVDLLVEDVEAGQDEMTRERRKGEPAARQTGERRIYRREYIVRGSGPADHEASSTSYGEKEKMRDVQVEEPGVLTSAHDATGGDSGRHPPVMEERKVAVRDEDEDGRREAKFAFNTSPSTDPGPPLPVSTPKASEAPAKAAADYPTTSMDTQFNFDSSTRKSPHAVMPSQAKVFEVGDEVLEDDMVRETTPPAHARVLLSPPPEDDIVNPWA